MYFLFHVMRKFRVQRSHMQISHVFIHVLIYQNNFPKPSNQGDMIKKAITAISTVHEQEQYQILQKSTKPLYWFSDGF